MKKLFTTIIALLLTLNAFALDVWNGSASPWTQGDGSLNNPYLIETASNLAYLAEKVNEGYQAQGMEVFKNTYFLLTDDLDLNNINWTPIGNVDYVNTTLEGFYFAGVFDGWYHNIDHLKIQTSASLAGLFAGLGGEWCGIIGQNDYGQIKHLSVTNGDITSTGFGVGGIVGAIAGDGTVSQCSFSGTIHISNSEQFCGAGGIAGAAGERGIIEECSFSGSITANNNGGLMAAGGASGIVALAINNASIRYCYNTGNITASAFLMSVAAGIVAATLQENNVEVNSCYNVGTLSAATKGGIFGMVSPVNPTKDETSITVTNCYYLNTCGGTTNYGTSMTAEQMHSAEFMNQIGGSFLNFVMDDGTNNGFPILSFYDYTLFDATNVTHNSAKISAEIWEGNVHFTEVKFIYYDIENGTINEMHNVVMDIEEHLELSLENLIPETEYGYMLSVTIENGTTRLTSPKYFTTDIDGVAEISNSEINIYPNPTSDFIFIENIEPQQITIYSLDGRLVKTVENANVVDVRDLKEGVYLINIDGRIMKMVKR